MFDQEQDTITGTVERITYYNEENGYSVIKITPDRKLPGATARDGTVAVVGVMPELGEGEAAEFTGRWVDDPKYGRQMRVEQVTPIQPNSLEGIRRYLASGIVKGIGEGRARRIVDHFGINTLDVLNRDPKRLHEVPGIKPNLADKIAQAWAENYAVRNTMVFLQQFGVTTRMAARIHAVYGAETILRVQENPYALADEVFGIGFIKADQIARNMGIEPNAPERIRAGISFALDRLSQDGHTYAPQKLLMDTVEELLRVDDRDIIEDELGKLMFSGDLEKEIMPGPDGERATAIYLPVFYRAEVAAARRLKKLANSESMIIDEVDGMDWPEFLADIAKQNNVELTKQQQGAVKAALQQKVSVLTGGPGTGKTTTLQMVIAALDDLDFRYALASPTGRAAKRLSEATKRPASTIHRLLGYNPADGFSADEDTPLQVDMLIVDEASMIDLMLFHAVLRALQPTTHLMLVGDVDQLPSVGAGNVLRDVINSDIAHVTRLETIFRQDEDSHIIVNAHRINNGEQPFTDNRSSDFFFFGAEDAAATGDLIVDIVTNRIPNKFGYDPMNDVQVIAPMYRGPAGVDALNTRLQTALNGDQNTVEKKLGTRLFRAGDKVMQTRNNYDKDVFNGDIGRIRGIDLDNSLLEIEFDGRFEAYDWVETEELMHAYCISTHRSQGSEYPVVVMPILTQHYMMLQRNLLYTAITRAKRMVVLVGSRKAIGIAVNNNKVEQRFCGLLERLKA